MGWVAQIQLIWATHTYHLTKGMKYNKGEMLMVI
jgi:hypothetical protein